MNESRFSQRRVLVTGGAGFIGSELVRQLVEQGDSVIVADNLVNGRREHLDGLSGPGRVRLAVTDIRDRQRMAELLTGIDVVYHLACLGVRHSVHSPAENQEVNATATLQLLIQARAAGVSRFVCVSSSEVYGTARSVPMTEDHPTWPMTVYGASKLAGECYARAFHHTYNFPTVVVRPFNTFGPRCHHEGDSGEVIPRFLLRCLAGQPLLIFGDGNQTRDFTFVPDSACGIALAGRSENAIGKTINLGSGAETSINQLAHEVAAVCGKADVTLEHLEPRPGDVLQLCANANLARTLLDWVPRVSLRDGLSRLHDWYLSSGRSLDELLQEEVIRNWEPVASSK